MFVLERESCIGVAISQNIIDIFEINFRCQKLQRNRRLLLLAERYVSTIESTYANNRIILPHAALFRGRPLKIKVINDAKKEEFIVEVIIQWLLKQMVMTL